MRIGNHRKREPRTGGDQLYKRQSTNLPREEGLTEIGRKSTQNVNEDFNSDKGVGYKKRCVNPYKKRLKINNE